MFKTKLRNVSMAILALVLSLSVVLGLANLKTNVANAATTNVSIYGSSSNTLPANDTDASDGLTYEMVGVTCKSTGSNFTAIGYSYGIEIQKYQSNNRYIRFDIATGYTAVVSMSMSVTSTGRDLFISQTLTSTNNTTYLSLSGKVGKTLYNGSSTELAAGTYYICSTNTMYILELSIALTSTGTPEPEPATTYAITCDNSIENGSVSCDVEEAEEGATVTVTASPNTGYECVDISVDGESVVGEGAVRTFIMPAKAVTVSAQFAKIPVSSVTLEAEGALPALADVKEKEGYTFVGWSASGTLYSAEEVAPAGDYTAAYAKTVAHGIGLCKSVEAIRYSFEIKIVDFEDTAIADIDSTEFINAVFTLELNAGDAEGIKGAEKSYETPNIAYCKDEDYDGYRINVVLVGNFDTYIDCAVDANLTSINLNGVKLSCDGILTAEDTMENIIFQLLISEYLTNAEAEMYGYIFEE